ncbi:barstar family protein [Streptomyces sp. NPDC059524]|uniref:barstar family protein n=1 Tax=Streptomyces sp. NPDC059524 TaxID=3346856 RepID=UPI0036888351
MTDGVFAQFYEALRLPDHFGWNWPALQDCLFDLHWISAERILLTIDDVHAVLSEEPQEREVPFRMLKDAAKHWAGKPDLPGQKKVSFEAVLLCPSDQEEQLLREIGA